MIDKTSPATLSRLSVRSSVAFLAMVLALSVSAGQQPESGRNFAPRWASVFNRDGVVLQSSSCSDKLCVAVGHASELSYSAGLLDRIESVGKFVDPKLISVEESQVNDRKIYRFEITAKPAFETESAGK